MSKNRQGKKSNGWVIAVAVIIALAIIREYPWILILAAVAFIAVVGIWYWRKRKAAQMSKQVPEAPTPATEKQKTATRITEYSLKGVFKCEKDIFHDLMEENPAYEYNTQELVDASMTDSPVYKWVPDMLPARLAPEPDNPYDKNAIRVYVGETLIGYIPKGKCLEVQKIIDDDRLLNVAYEITGGKYKLVTEDYDPSTDKSEYTMESGYEEVAAKVYIKEQL